MYLEEMCQELSFTLAAMKINIVQIDNPRDNPCLNLKQQNNIKSQKHNDFNLNMDMILRSLRLVIHSKVSVIRNTGDRNFDTI